MQCMRRAPGEAMVTGPHDFACALFFCNDIGKGNPQLQAMRRGRQCVCAWRSMAATALRCICGWPMPRRLISTAYNMCRCNAVPVTFVCDADARGNTPGHCDAAAGHCTPVVQRTAVVGAASAQGVARRGDGRHPLLAFAEHETVLATLMQLQCQRCRCHRQQAEQARPAWLHSCDLGQVHGQRPGLYVVGVRLEMQRIGGQDQPPADRFQAALQIGRRLAQHDAVDRAQAAALKQRAHCDAAAAQRRRCCRCTDRTPVLSISADEEKTNMR